MRDIIVSNTFKEYLEKLGNCINRELIDNAALEFLSHFNRKALRKRLVQNLIKAPTNRLDLLPFYARFLATLRPIAGDVTKHVLHELLKQFREIMELPTNAGKLKGEKKSRQRTDILVHLCKYISELVTIHLLVSC